LGALLVADAAHAEDARYVGAALRAAAEVSGRAIAVTTAAPDDPAATGAAARPAAWIVWLAARPVPPALRARVRAGARLLTTGDTGLDSTSAGALVPWPGAADAPPLEARVAGAGRWYRFAGRFHPDAGDLVLRPAFAERLATLVLGDSLPARSSTPRPVARTQLLPARDTTSPARATRTAAPPPARAPLATPLWLAALALFALERAVVARRARAA
ncbi:MAG TPA: hypothetical protein VFS40_07915, partial [Gemmatimonadales bacterium]|nr:hypothetical protein [Gemmatimonadales bacterium]